MIRAMTNARTELPNIVIKLDRLNHKWLEDSSPFWRRGCIRIMCTDNLIGYLVVDGHPGVHVFSENYSMILSIKTYMPSGYLT